jgi:hypothetical protein
VIFEQSNIKKNGHNSVILNLDSFLYNKYLYFSIIFLFSIFSILYIKIFGVNLISPDEFVLVYKVVENKLPLLNFSFLHSEHFMYASLLIYTIIAKASHLNSIAIMICSMLLLDLIYILYMIYIYKKEERRISIFLPLIFGLIIFSPRKFEIFLTAMGITYIMALVFTLISFFIFQKYCIDKPKNILSNIKYILLMIICSLIAFVSCGQGMTTSISISMIWLLNERKATFKNIYFYLWLIFTITILYVYIFTTPINQNNSLISNIFNNPVGYIHYCFRYIGNIASNSLLGFFITLLSSLIFIDFVKNNNKINIFPILIILNNLLICASTAATRFEFGPQHGSASRYVFFGVMIVLGCVLYIYQNDNLKILRFNINTKNKIFIIPYSILLLIISAYFFIGFNASKKDYENKNLLKFYFQTYKTQPKEFLKQLFPPDVKFFIKTAEILEINKLNVFYDKNSVSTAENSFTKQYLDNYQDYMQFDRIDIVNSETEPYIIISGTLLPKNILNKSNYTYIILNENKYLCYDIDKNKFHLKRSKREKDSFIRSVPLNLLEKGIYNPKIQFINSDNKIIYEINSNIWIINFNNTYRYILQQYKF